MYSGGTRESAQESTIANGCWALGQGFTGWRTEWHRGRRILYEPLVARLEADQAGTFGWLLCRRSVGRQQQRRDHDHLPGQAKR
jgi:hypothetical protein